MLRRMCLYYSQVRYIRRLDRKVIDRLQNPGIENRTKILRMESKDVEHLESIDLDFDDFESDFNEAGSWHREYEREKLNHSKKLSYIITRDKYFKPPKLPNFLTWEEKEQIRHLHQLDPNEWDIETLSKSFPASSNVIKKILKAKWKPKNKVAQERHDSVVQRNWRGLMEGKFTLSDEFKRHLLSFSSRRFIFSSEDVRKTVEPVALTNCHSSFTEFSDIVKNETTDMNVLGANREKINEGNEIKINIPRFLPKMSNPQLSDPKSDSYVLPMKTENSDLISYSEFKEELMKSLSEDSERNQLSKKYYDYLNSGDCETNKEKYTDERGQPENAEPKNEKFLSKYKKKELQDNLTSEQVDMFMKAENYRNKIRIPKEKKNSSMVYKVKDCFYDRDGKFLYRVPGMK